MKQNLLTILALLIFTAINAQRDFSTGNTSTNVMHSVHGTIAGSKYDDIKNGSPYFSDQWMTSTIYLIDGKEINGINVKIDLLANRVIYQQNNIAYEADAIIKKIVMEEDDRSKKFQFINASTIGITEKALPNEWYLLLEEGKASLYKGIQKKLEESRQYGSAVIEKTVTTKETYFLYYNNAFIKIDRINELTKVLTNKKHELQQYIETQNLKKLTDENIAQVVKYFNTL